MSVLDKILSKKRERLAEAKATAPLPKVRAKAESAGEIRGFSGSISRGEGRIRLIAELKKASPSRGIIREDFDPGVIAGIYAARASALSVLTEEDFFQGHLSYISRARAAAPVPALRKDFIFDEYQVYEARANGADAVLLIDAALEFSQAGELMHLATELGMAVLYEVHDHQELERALKLNTPIIGINNRNLKTLEIDLNTTFELRKEISQDHIIVSESGISSHADVLRLEDAGIDAMLVGTQLMRSGDISSAMEELLGPLPTQEAL